MAYEEFIEEIKRDAVYNEILSNQYFIRLRGVKQLGFAYLDWKKATHTRYAHSVGSAELAYCISRLIGLPIPKCKILAYSAALHEVGTPPYSYSITKEICDAMDFDKVKMAEKVVKKHFSSILKGETGKVVEIISREKKNEIDDQIVFGLVGANTLDFLSRDSQNTIPIFSKDLLKTIVGLVVKEHDSLVLEKGYKDLYYIIHGAKKLMNHNVYFSPKRRIADMMLSEALKYVLENKRSNYILEAFNSTDHFKSLSDNSLLSLLSSAVKGTQYESMMALLSSDSVFESLNIPVRILRAHEEVIDSSDFIHLVTTYIQKDLQVDKSDFIVDSPLNFVVRFHGEKYEGEAKFNHTLPPELLSFADLFSEPAINRKRKKALRTKTKWMIYYHPKVQETISKLYSNDG
ncbi:hypothetical protein [Pseudodesulfovibrio sp. zrk46]|uniref:hypothetical protein n=1 Tax=Pseudodesulfovibrio sp. zrk46 TaxID=2725288 RepID=UPI001449BD5D|nr:hypothetical protein [Pseudodesulfovibrio sp. zrk46]QJB56550.1 hypothetical protein HFN16_09070 [Pseudodesulfovibrio sp. zrk46]